MKFILPVILREYDTTWIAETLSLPEISVAGDAAQPTLDRLRTAIIDIYSRTHPRMLKNAMDPHPVEVVREVRPVYQSGRYEWSQVDNTSWHDNLVPVPIDVLSTKRNEDLQEITLLQYNLKSIGRKSDTEQKLDVIDEMLSPVRENSWAIVNHRPLSKSTKIVHLEIDFEPIDLSKVPPETIFINEFSRNALVGGMSEEASPTLNKVAQKWDFKDQKETEEKGFSEIFGREKLVDEIQSLIDGEKAVSIVLVGPTRVGKTALLRHLAWVKNLSSDQKSEHKKALSRTLFFADSPRLVSTAPQGGLWQEQVQNILSELESTDSILYIGRLIAALDAGKYDGSDYNLAQFIRPYLSNDRIRVVAEASIEEWAEIERRDVGFARNFTVVRVEDPASKPAQIIIQKAAKRIAEKLDFELSDEAISRAWLLQKRFAVYGSPVGRTIEFIARTVRRALANYKKTLSENDLVEAFCEDTGLPPVLLLDSQQLRPQTVFDALAKRVVGQDAAIQSVSNIVSITKAGLSSPDRPLGSFMFVGPTGVGKTELAKALAAFLFGSEDRMIRLDMSEYSQGDAYGRLIGEGSQDGELAGPVRREPFSVVLLDEIEKAHPSVYDVLLQVLGEARLTDVKGRTTRFQNTIIIMTSNLGVDNMRPAIGFGDASGADYSEHFRKEAERFYRPEFLGRIDQFIAFKSLPLEVVTQIARRSLKKIQDRDGFVSQDVTLNFDDAVAGFLAKKGYHEKYGARPLKREIEQELVWKLADQLARTKDKVDAGGTPRALPPGRARKINVSVEKDGLKFVVNTISATKKDFETRSRLLSQVDEVSNLRRRLSSYVHTVLFGELEWEIENFDISTQSPQFWSDPRAAELASNAEKIRRVIVPADEITAELESLEDLSTEAYHTRSFDLLPEIESRLEVLEKGVDNIFVQAMNVSYDMPDEVVLFLFDRSPHQDFYQILIDWYEKWAAANNWEFSICMPVDAELPPEEYRADFDLNSWKEVDSAPDGIELLAISMKGFNARPMLRVEEGLHRYVSSSGNGTCQVVVRGEQAAWPYSQDVAKRSYPNFPARTYNFRINDVTMHFGVRQEFYGGVLETVSAKLDPEDPISALADQIRDEAWYLSALDWE